VAVLMVVMKTLVMIIHNWSGNDGGRGGSDGPMVVVMIVMVMIKLKMMVVIFMLL
jgi:hypothetical protein